MSENDAAGFKKRLEDAKTNSKKIKLWFYYPGAISGIKKSGIVKEVYEDSFTMLETLDGECTFSYSYLAEISEDKDNKLDRWRNNGKGF